MKGTISTVAQWDALNQIVRRRLAINPEKFEYELGEIKRTTKQNALLHSIFEQCEAKITLRVRDKITKLWSDTKKPASWWKDELKSKLGRKEVHFDIEENPTVIIVSTAKYTKSDMNDFVTKIQAYIKQTYDADIDIKEMQEHLTTKGN